MRTYASSSVRAARRGGLLRRLAATVLALTLAVSLMLDGGAVTALAASKTGVGMAEWALRAYNEGWNYVYGGSEAGAVDCSGLIRSYIKGGGGAKALLDAAPSSGKISTMPRVHGLGLWCDGHAGVYVGKNDKGTNMAVDARNERVDVVYDEMTSRTYNPWVKWFKIKGVTYPTTGWVTFNGKKFYYNNGEFVVGEFTVDGTTYDFGKSGALRGEVDKSTTTTAAVTTTAAKTTTTTKAASSALKKGVSGDVVTKLQKRLIELGYMNVEATGYYGDQTVEAVKLFQKAAGLQADGVAGKTTQEKLYADSAPRRTTAAAKTTTTAKPASLKKGMSGDAVTKLQKRLIELGYMTVEATGYYGEQTADAVKLFQKTVGLTADGVAGEATRDKLYADGAPKRTTTTTTKKTTTTTTTTTTTKATTTTTTTTTSAARTAEKTETTTKKTTTTTKQAVTTAETTAETTTTTTTTTTTVHYAALQFGSSGTEVTDLQNRLAELGYYSYPISNYYGTFLKVAVAAFQSQNDLPVTGVADNDTQRMIFEPEAKPCVGEVDSKALYSEIELQEDGGEREEETEAVEETIELAPSEGLGAYSTRSDIMAFISEYGGAGMLQTLGVYSYSAPEVLMYRDGECYRLSDEMTGAMEDCVFY